MNDLEEAKRLLRDCQMGLRVLYAIGKSRSYKTVGKVEVPSWGKPVMERSGELLDEIALFLVKDVKIIKSASLVSGEPATKGE